MKEVCGLNPHVIEGDGAVAEELLAMVADDHHHVGPVGPRREARAVHKWEQVKPRQRHLVLVMEMVAWPALVRDQTINVKSNKKDS